MAADGCEPYDTRECEVRSHACEQATEEPTTNPYKIARTRYRSVTNEWEGKSEALAKLSGPAGTLH